MTDLIIDLVTKHTKQVLISSKKGNIKTTVRLSTADWLSVKILTYQLGFSLNEFFTMLEYYRELCEQDLHSRRDKEVPLSKGRHVTLKEILDEMKDACSLGAETASRMYPPDEILVFVNKKINENFENINSFQELIKNFPLAPADKHSQRFTLDLFCGFYESDDTDPLLQIFKWIDSSVFCPQRVVKTLYSHLLASNVVYDDMRNEDDLIRHLLSVEKYEPFGWYTNFFVEIARINETGRTFHFLTNKPSFHPKAKMAAESKKIKKRKIKKIIISTSDPQGALIYYTSHILCEKLRRSRSALFKMILMNYFEWAGVVNRDDGGILVLAPNWTEKLKTFFEQAKDCFL